MIDACQMSHTASVHGLLGLASAARVLSRCSGCRFCLPLRPSLPPRRPLHFVQRDLPQLPQWVQLSAQSRSTRCRILVPRRTCSSTRAMQRTVALCSSALVCARSESKREKHHSAHEHPPKRAQRPIAKQARTSRCSLDRRLSERMVAVAETTRHHIAQKRNLRRAHEGPQRSC